MNIEAQTPESAVPLAELRACRDVAIAIAREAGQLLKTNFGGRRQIDLKGEIDLVTEMDRRSEQFMVDALSREYPEHAIVAEEGSRRNTETRGDYRWYIDPLDGTTNYAHGLPVYCVTLALEHRGTTLVGVVYDPERDELFTAIKADGAFLNGRTRLSVSPETELTNAFLATGFPYDIRTSDRTNLEHFARFAKRARAVRRMGSAAIDLCYTACGRFTGFWEMKLAPWDVAAAALMVEEAGGVVTDFAGGPLDLTVGDVLAANTTLHARMQDVLAETQDTSPEEKDGGVD